MSRFVVNDESRGLPRVSDINVDPDSTVVPLGVTTFSIAEDSLDGSHSERHDDTRGRNGDCVTNPTARRTASPVRLTLCGQLGRRIDGAWWPHSNRLARELPELVGVLYERLGDVVDISVNWSMSENLPDLNSRHWQNKHQHLMTVTGRNACANLLIVPSLTPGTLAGLVLRLAAGLPLSAALQATPLFKTAAEIVDAARVDAGAPRPPGSAPPLATSGKKAATVRARRTSKS